MSKPILRYKDIMILNPNRFKVADKPFEMIITATANTFTLPLRNGYVYDMLVDWGDSSTSTITAYNQAEITHTYPTTGNYNIKITGKCGAFYFNNGGDKLKLKSIVSWGNLQLDIMEGGFRGCTQLASIPNSPITGATLVTNMLNSFNSCSLLNAIPEGFLSQIPLLEGVGGTFVFWKITSIPSNLFANNPNVTSAQSLFAYCTLLTSVGSGVFDNIINCQIFTSCFQSCVALTTIPDNLFLYNINATDYAALFQGCKKLNVTSNMFNSSYLYKVTSFLAAFKATDAVNSFTGTAQDIWIYATNPSLIKTGCFQFDVNLTNYASIPDNWKGL